MLNFDGIIVSRTTRDAYSHYVKTWPCPTRSPPCCSFLILHRNIQSQLLAMRIGPETEKKAAAALQKLKDVDAVSAREEPEVVFYNTK